MNYTYTSGCLSGPFVPNEDQVTAQVYCRAEALSRTVTVGGTGNTWNYTYNGTSAGTVTDPDRNDTVHTYSQIVIGSAYSSYTVETQVSYYQGSSGSGQLLKSITTNYTGEGCGSNGGYVCNIRPIRVTTTLDNGIVKKEETDYETFPFNGGTYTRLNPIEIREYDYGNALLRRTDYTYLHNSNQTYANLNIVDRPTSAVMYNSGGAAVSQTSYEYDNYTAGIHVSGAVQHDSTRGSSYTTRGNVTALEHWRNTDGAWLTTRNQYDDAGNVVSQTDPLNHPTSYGYGDSWTPGGGSCAPSGGQAAAFVTQVTNALNQTTNYTYFSCTGFQGSITDPNSQTTSYAYDMFGRRTQITYPDTGQTTYCYTDEGGSTCTQTGPPFSVVTTKKMSPSQNFVTTDSYDGLGRLSQHELNSDSGGADFTVWSYDSVGRIATITNPYRSGDTVYTTAYSYDALNRTRQLTNPDNSTVTTSYTGRATTVTDESGKQRVSQVDGLGRLTSVCEVTSTTLSVGITGSTTPAACNLDISATGFLTAYGYDALDDLTSVAEGPLNGRSFSYNSLAQLTSATNPESGMTSYTYDANGNLATKVAPAPNQTGSSTVTTTFSYDALNRITQKSFSDGTTPTVQFGYDIQNVTIGTINAQTTNYIGRMSWETTLGSVTKSVFSYDPMGRINELWSCQNVSCTASILYSIYSYDGIGDELSRSINGGNNSETYDGAGHLASFTNSYSDPTNPGTFLSGATYDPFGHMVFANLGNGLSESWKYDNRGRLVSEAAGTGCTAGAGTCTTTKYGASVTYFANGNVMSANDTADGNWVYTYDDFNRLISSAGGPNNYSYAYAYDRFGNRWNQTLNGGCTAGTAVCVQFDANNHMTNLVQTYDAAGNVLSDSMHTYRYDAENHLISVDNGSTTYFYDAEGRRLERRTNGTATRDWYYNRDGTTLIEIAPPYPLYQEMYAAGLHIATRTLNAAHNGTDEYFHHVDWLGTERARTDYAGSLCETITSLPFGDGQNFSSTCPEGDVSPLHFTGKERDSESGLDNFGARYNASSMGRFMTPDPLGGIRVNPQSLNKYAYVRNNPVNLTDPTGLYTCRDDNNQCKSKQDQAFEKSRQQDLKSKDPNVVRAAKAYGDPTKDGPGGNKVSVGFADLSKKGEGGVTTSTVATDDKGNLVAKSDVTINSKISGSELDAAVGHEGSHVGDAQDVVSSISLTNTSPYFKVGADISRYTSEQRAYAVTDSILRSENESAHFGCGASDCVLGTGLTMRGQLTDTIDRILSNSEIYRSNGQPLSPTNQGGSVVNGLVPQ